MSCKMAPRQLVSQRRANVPSGHRRSVVATRAIALCLCLAAVVTHSSHPSLFASAGGGGEEPLPGLLKQICQPASGLEAPVLTSPSQVRQVLAAHEQELSNGGDGETRICDPKYDEALEALGKLLAPEQLQDVCSKQMYELIRAFHLKFVHYYVPEATRDELLAAAQNLSGGGGGTADKIPETLKSFFVMFAKQTGATCKQHLVSRMQRLRGDSADRISLLHDEDYAVIEKYKRESQRLGFMWQLTKMGLSSFGRDKANKFNQLQIVDLLRERINNNNNPRVDLGEGAKLYVQVRFDDRLKRIQTACEKRFMPVYMALFAPVIKLNNLGYIDHTKSTVEDKQLNEEELFLRWYDIIQTCEVLKDVVVLHDSTAFSALIGIIQDNSHLQASNGEQQAEARKVKILTPDEARQLQERVDKAQDGVIESTYDPERVQIEHERVQFTPRMWLTTRKEVERELNKFNKDIGRYVNERTSLSKALRAEIKMYVKNFFHKHKNEIADRDQSTALGQLTVFFERHRVLFMALSLLMSALFMSMMFG